MVTDPGRLASLRVYLEALVGPLALFEVESPPISPEPPSEPQEAEARPIEPDMAPEPPAPPPGGQDGPAQLPAATEPLYPSDVYPGTPEPSDLPPDEVLSVGKRRIRSRKREGPRRRRRDPLQPQANDNPEPR